VEDPASVPGFLLGCVLWIGLAGCRLFVRVALGEVARRSCLEGLSWGHFLCSLCDLVLRDHHADSRHGYVVPLNLTLKPDREEYGEDENIGPWLSITEFTIKSFTNRHPHFIFLEVSFMLTTLLYPRPMDRRETVPTVSMTHLTFLLLNYFA